MEYPYERQQKKKQQQQKADFITRHTGLQPEIYLSVLFGILLLFTLFHEHYGEKAPEKPMFTPAEAGILMVAQ